MSITVFCPHCNAAREGQAAPSGRHFLCLSCRQTTVLVPDDAPALVEPIPQAPARRISLVLLLAGGGVAALLGFCCLGSVVGVFLWPRLGLSQTNVRDFIDNTSRYKDRSVTLRLKCDIGSADSLRGFQGRPAPFYGFAPTGEKLKIHITLPDNLDLPNARYGDDVIVTFICDGTTGTGNVATSVRRP